MKRIYVIVFMLIFLLVGYCKAFAGDLNYSEQLDFEKSFVVSCFEGQRKQRTNEGFEDWQIKKYCECTARKVSHLVTYDELAYVINNRNQPESLVKKIERSGHECLSHLMKKWGFWE